MNTLRDDSGRFTSGRYEHLSNGRDGGNGFDAVAEEHADGTATARVESVGGKWWQEIDCDTFEEALEYASEAFQTGSIPYPARKSEVEL